MFFLCITFARVVVKKKVFRTRFVFCDHIYNSRSHQNIAHGLVPRVIKSLGLGRVSHAASAIRRCHFCDKLCPLQGPISAPLGSRPSSSSARGEAALQCMLHTPTNRATLHAISKPSDNSAVSLPQYPDHCGAFFLNGLFHTTDIGSLITVLT
ncbi:hypothetical protein B0F90DRAFT_1136777 [Multifurca ochricompacta]|uniref:Uncharacterized protein n=1 Tax=Multifurca ochricompacta TaxID=376703 RepID=A0AAD4M0Q4_9AGAM|nr:hypothetical protein B0F90DRAFT_1136777 [Multifurca ochricompacta]